MSIKLIAFDLDGTFFNTRKDVPPQNLQVLGAARTRGILTVPASGRLYPGMPEQLKGDGARYFILGNGLTAYDSVKNIRFFEYDMSKDRALRLFDYADSIGVYCDYYAADRSWTSQWLYDRVPLLFPNTSLHRVLRQLRTPVPDLRAHLISQPDRVQKVTFYFTDPELRLQQLRTLPALFPDLNVTSSHDFNIELVDRRADKGAALLALCENLGIPPEDSMAIGDGLNDLGMITAAGVGVAMGNSDERLKARADYVSGDCDSDGFAGAVRKFALER